ncbi:MAG TPA: FHIPEP family type III secretion protein, partial [Spirochaetota bacterium]|nr:FHIPEP family type III secretion protein [Spirochaetota bacterium]HOK92431.1 FHIPEP family type III secretion protein [Spirochaetota bacterium]
SALDMGLIVPPIRIRDNMELEPEVYSILIKGVEVGRGKLQVGKLMAMDSGDVREKITGVEFIEPVFNLNAIWIEPDVRDLAESRGYTVVDCPTIIATHLTEIIKRHADEILGREEVKKLIDNIRNDYPAVVKEVEERIKYGEIQKVLQNLLRERVSIRNMVTILETLATYYNYTQDTGMLTEYVRGALSRQIVGSLVNEDNVLSVITVDPEIESIIRNSIYEDPVEGRVVGMDPDTHNIVVNSLLEAYTRASRMGFSPIFLVSPQIRSVTFALLEREIQAPVVLAYNEIPKNIKVNIVVSALLPATA